MGFKTEDTDKIEAVAYTSSYSAKSILNGIENGSDYLLFEEREEDVYTYEDTVYRVTITIEPV